MSERMLTDEEIGTLEYLKEKVKFQNQLIKAIEHSVIETTSESKKEQERRLRHFFLEESFFWKRKKLTESEYERAIQLLKREVIE